MAVQIQLRRGTAAEWTAANPVIASGELVVESDTNKLKLGNGVTAWTSLAYFKPGQAIDDLTDVTVTSATTGDVLKYNSTSGLWENIPVLGYETTALSASTKTLTNLSPRNQFFTGSTTGQIVNLPDTATLSLGDEFIISNLAPGVTISVRTSTSTAILTQAVLQKVRYTCVSTAGNTAAAWQTSFEGSTTGTGNGSLVYSISPTLTAPTLNSPSLVLQGSTSSQSGRLTYVGSTLKLGNGTTTVTFSDDSVNATTYAAASHTHTLANITDVNITSPTNGQSLTYDSASSKWINSAAAATGETISSFLLMGA